MKTPSIPKGTTPFERKTRESIEAILGQRGDGMFIKDVLGAVTPDHIGYAPVNKAGDTMSGVLGTPGIKFPATQTASTDVNTLDDYEEGTFTAVFKGGATTVATTTNNYYTKVGNVVTVYLRADNFTGAAGAFTIEGLPFPVGVQTGGLGSPMCQNVTFTGVYNHTAYILVNDTVLRPYGCLTAAAWVQAH